MAVLTTGWYRFVTSWRRLGAGYLALALIVGLGGGLGGGLALGSVAAALRTASSFSVFLASTNPSDVTIEPAGGLTINLASDRRITDAVAHFPHVRHVESYVALGATYTIGSRTINDFTSSVLLVGSVDGLLLNQDRLTVIEGQRADSSDPHQVMVTEMRRRLWGCTSASRWCSR